MTLPEFLLERLDDYERAIDEVTSTYFDAPMSESEMYADLDAKRRIVGWIVGQDPRDAESLAFILSALALPYAEHPDYSEAWRA